MPPDASPSLLDYHVLLALACRPMHGYAVRDAVEEESDGALAPRAGSLYRVLARLMVAGLVVETDAPDDAEGLRHPGRARRYYELTREGRAALASGARRLEAASALALERLGARP